MAAIVRALRDARADHPGFTDLYGKRPGLNRIATERPLGEIAFDTGGPRREALSVRCPMQPSTITTPFPDDARPADARGVDPAQADVSPVDAPQAATARPMTGAPPSPRPHWGDRALLAAERRLLPPRARPLSRAAARGQRGLWFRTAAIFMVSLSAGLLGLNAFLLFNAPQSEAASLAFEREAAPADAALPAPVAPPQGVVANAAGVGRVIFAGSQPVATLSTDAYAVVGQRVQAAQPQRDDGASRSSAVVGLEAPSAPIPVNASPSAYPASVAESQARADEAMRVIAASTPSLHRTEARDPAFVGGTASVEAPAETSAAQAASAGQGVWYGDGGLR